MAWITRLNSGHRTLGDVVTIEQAPIAITGYEVHVVGVYVANVGLSATRKRIQEQGCRFVLTPTMPAMKVSLVHLG